MKERDVSVLILYNSGKILLQKRAKDAKRFPNLWGLFGGGVEKEETPESALIREIDEELGLKVSNPKFLRKYPYVLKEIGEKGVVWVYFLNYNGDNLYLCEGDCMEWFLQPEALLLDMHPIYRQIIEDIGQGDVSVLL